MCRIGQVSHKTMTETCQAGHSTKGRAMPACASADVIATIIPGVVTSAFTFLKVGAYYQEIVKRIIIIGAAVLAGGRRQSKPSRA